MKNILYLICTIAFLTSSCKSIKMDSIGSAKKLVEFHRSACYGDCPYYSMTVMTDGSVSYNGKRNVEKMGIYEYQMDKKSYVELVKALESADLYQYDEFYNKRVEDGQATTIAYYGAKGLKKITSKLRYPGDLEITANKLDALANSQVEWVAVNVPANQPEVEVPMIEKEDKPTSKIASYSQGACFGKCPVYTLDILTNRTALLVRKQFTEKEGIFEKELSTTEYTAITELLEGREFQSLESIYDEGLMDAQQFKVEYYGEGDSKKKVVTKITKPAVLQEIIDLMQDLESGRGWKMKELKDSKDVKNTLLISVKPQTQSKKWVESKKHLGLELVRYLSPNGTYFLVSYDTKLDANRVMEELRRDRDVLEVRQGDQSSRQQAGSKTGKSGPRGKGNLGGNNGN